MKKILIVLSLSVALLAPTIAFANSRYDRSDDEQEQEQEQEQHQDQHQDQYQGQHQDQYVDVEVEVDNHIDINNDVDIDNTNVNINDVDIDNTNINNNNSSAEVVIADGAIRTGDQTVTVNDGDVSTNVEVNTGDVDVNVAPTQNVTFISPEPLPGVFHVGTSYLPEPPLFNESVDAAEGGIGLAEWFNSKCKPQYTRRKPLKAEKGKVGDTFIVFAPHQNLAAKARKSDADTVRFSRPEGPQKCLGIVTAESVSKEINSLGAIVPDVATYVLRHVRNVGEIYLVALPDSVTANRSVTTYGRGFSLLTSISKVLESQRAVAGLGGGIAGNSGKTFNRARLGNTWVVTTPDEENGIPIKFEPEKVSEVEEEVPDAPPSNEVAEAPEPASMPVVDTTILDRDPNDFGPRQIQYVTP